MDLVELGDMGSGCEDKNCGLASGFQEDCSNEECHWEEPMFGMTELACVTAIYIPLMLFGLLGNILTILVVWLRPHMRSSTYLYLSSMAVSDLLILLLLPLDLYKLWRPRPWPLGDLACKLTMFLSECCTFCTILHITFLSLERYVAVCWPITAKTLVTRRRTRALIGCLWLGAAVSAAPVLVMVGVEEVGMEELALSGWTGDTGWTSREGEQDAFLIGQGEGGSEHMNWMDGRFEEIKWEEKETKGWSERVGEEGNRKQGTKEGEVGEIQDGKETDQEGGGEDEGNMEDDGMQQNKLKEDEGGGGEEGVDAGRYIDNRECRCTHYAVSSGLLSAMMILSNLYFLVPLCILGLVYSLIGRTLWLRPKSSRKDQSHRHTVKMLGVIVLAFVLCWLPFHVGRTIFSLSLGNGAERQEMHMDTPHSDMTTLPDSTGDMQHINQPDTYAHIKSPLMPAHVETDTHGIFCDACAKSKDRTDTHPHVMSHTTPAKSAHTTTHTEMNNDQTPVNTQLSNFADSNNRPRCSTNTTTYNNSTTMCIDSQNDTISHTPSPSGTGTYATTPTDLHNTHNDAHLYFLYYLSQYFNLVSSVLFYLSAAVNPLLYNLMSARYRHAVHSLIHARCHTQSHRLHTTLSAQQSTTTI